jgi:hypothetical protein
MILNYITEKLISLEKKWIHRLINTIDNVNSRSDKTGKRERKKERRKRRAQLKKGEGEENEFSVKTSVQVKAIYKSVKQNYIFYISLLICVYAFTKCTYNKSSIFLGLFSLFFITFYGYLIHLVSHYMGTTLSDLYKTYDNIFTRNKYLNWIAIKTIEFGEFHAKTHHDSDINKSWSNIALEFINNLVSQGGLLIMLKFFLRIIDNRVILLWAFFYATVHNINYNIMPPLTHKQHHMNDKTNYGIDIWDIIVGSKYDWEEIETHNHSAINILIIGAIIVLVCNKFKI